MTIPVRCECGSRFQVRDEYAGKKAQCPACGTVVVIPGLSAELEEVPEADDFPRIDTTPASRPRKEGVWWAGLSGGFLGLTRQSGIFFLMTGLLLVVMSRGCDSTAAQSMAKKSAKYKLVQNQWEDEWEEKLAPLAANLRDSEDRVDEIEGRNLELVRLQNENFDQARLDEINRNRKLISDEEEKQQELEQEQRKQLQEKTKERKRKLQEDWRPYQTAVRDASIKNTGKRWWRAWMFLIGTMVLLVGLLTVVATGDGPERIICMAMIAILTISLYIGGFAWMDTIISNIETRASVLDQPFLEN